MPARASPNHQASQLRLLHPVDVVSLTHRREPVWVCTSGRACIDLDDVPVGIWLVLLMSIRQLLSMNGVGGYLAHTAVVPSYLPLVSMATNGFLMRSNGTSYTAERKQTPLRTATGFVLMKIERLHAREVSGK